MATSTVQGEKRPEASTGGEGGERSSPSWQGGNDIALHGLQSASQPAIQLVANISLPGKQRADCCQFADWKTKAQQDLVSAQRHLGSELSLKPVTLALYRMPSTYGWQRRSFRAPHCAPPRARRAASLAHLHHSHLRGLCGIVSAAMVLATPPDLASLPL